MCKERCCFEEPITCEQAKGANIDIAKLQAEVTRTRLEKERADWIRRHNDKAAKLQTAQAEVTRLEKEIASQKADLEASGSLIIEELGRKCESLQAKIEQHRWIPVGEGPPEITGWVWAIVTALHTTEGCAIVARYTKKDGWISDNGTLYTNTPLTITHWKPIILPKGR